MIAPEDVADALVPLNHIFKSWPYTWSVASLRQTLCGLHVTAEPNAGRVQSRMYHPDCQACRDLWAGRRGAYVLP